MPEPLLSPSWYRVARLRPSLRGHARFHRHLYRGQVWHVLQDRASGRCHRLTPAAYQLVGLMDGERTTQQLWDAACTVLGDDAPSQDETIRLLGLLHAVDVLRCNVSPDLAELFRRTQRREQREWWQRVASPLSLRMPLADPDRFLARWSPWVAPLFTRAGALLCGLPVLAALVLAGLHAEALAAAGPRQLLDPRTWLLLWLVYPVVKGLHELGHAFATRIWGGEVHEMGVLFLVLIPVPYVDASAASVFPDKHRRMAVGAAGIVVELVLAALALLLWLAVEPGVVRDIAYAVMWTGGASALLFNGNPLLRYDGYYVLADALEIPNLKGRSTQYLAHLGMRHAFGVEPTRDPVSAPGEPGWFVAYGVASFFYRMAVLFGIALFISQKFFVVGLALAALVLATGIVLPVLRQAAFLLTGPRLGARRPRVLAVSAGGLAAAALLLCAVPTPVFTRTQGVVWPPEGSQVRARADGFVVELLAVPGSPVAPGQPLVRTRDPELEADAAILAAKLRETRARHAAVRRTNRARARILGDELRSLETQLARARERVGDVVVRSPAAGRFVVARADDLPGRFVEQGQSLGWVVGEGRATARVVVPQSEAALVRTRTRGVQVRLASRVGEILEARVQREVPAASDRLPTAALGAAGGGPFAIDPGDESGLRTQETVFHFDLGLPERVSQREIGTRVHVRFDHGFETLASRVGRAGRLLFLRHFGGA